MSWQAINANAQEVIMDQDANQMSTSVPPILASMGVLVKMASVILFASAKMAMKAKGVNKKSICASQIHVNMVGYAKPISIPTVVNASQVLKGKIVRSTLMIAF